MDNSEKSNTMESNADGAKRTKRPKRTPLGTRNVLIATERKGFVRRYVNDVDDRIERAKAAGYTPVTTHSDASDPRAGSDSRMGAISSKSVGGGVRAVLMEIPEKFYQEDQAAKQEQVDRSEEGLSRQKGIDGQQYGGVYGKVKVSRRGKTRDMGAESGEPD